MSHETVKVNDVHNFAWFVNRSDAIKKFKKLDRNGIVAKIGGKRARSWRVYNDLKTAAIYQNAWTGSGAPWVVAW